MGRIVIFGVVLLGVAGDARGQARVPTVAELARRLEAVEAALAELKGAAVMAPALSEGRDGLAARVATLEAALGRLSGPGVAADVVERVDGLEGRLAALERDVAAARAAIDDAANARAMLGAAPAGGDGGAPAGWGWDDGFGWRSA